MEREALKQSLNACFKLTVSQMKEKSGHGYRLHLTSSWPINDVSVKGFWVQLVGTDPLTGRNVEDDGIVAKFSYDQKKHITFPLTYHGDFRLRCVAVLKSGEELELRQQEVHLEYPANKPWIQYKCVPQSGFMLVKVTSNCWNHYQGRVWAKYDRHEQQINLPAAADGSLSFYLPTSDTPELRIPGETGIMRKG